MAVEVVEPAASLLGIKSGCYGDGLNLGGSSQHDVLNGLDDDNLADNLAVGDILGANEFVAGGEGSLGGGRGGSRGRLRFGLGLGLSKGSDLDLLRA